MSKITRTKRDALIRQRLRRDLGANGLEELMNASPSWSTCAELHKLYPSDKLGRIMGAIASALRSGSEVVHEDWGDDWIEYSLIYLEGMEPLERLTSDREYERLNHWLDANEERIVKMIHLAYVHEIRSTSEKAASLK